MPEDSIMDLVDNIEELYNAKIELFERWVQAGENWERREAHREALRLATRFADTLEAREMSTGRYTGGEINVAAKTMLDQFETYREEELESRIEQASKKASTEEPRMDPGDVEHARKYEELAREIGIEELKSLIPVPSDKVRRALERGDSYLNSIPLRKWDAAAGNIRHPQRRLTLSEGVCVLKHVAKWHYA